MLHDPVRVTIDLSAFAAHIVRGDGRPASETDAAALLRELGWTYDGRGWRGERRALPWLHNLGPIDVETGETTTP
jgi:hypothetical protein